MYETDDVPDAEDDLVEKSGENVEEELPPPPVERQKPKSRAPELPSIERRNWLIHSHFVRKEFDTCRALIKEQLDESKGLCEYALFAKGLILRHDGQIHDSMEAFQACAQMNPRSTVYLKQIARNLFLLGRQKQAIEVFSEVAKMTPDDWEAFHWQAVCHYHMNNNSAAKESLKDALHLRRHEKSLQLLGKIYTAEGDFLHAVEAYKKCAELSPQENPDLMTSLGLLYMKLDSENQAFEALGRALAFNPSHSGAILAAGTMMQKHGDHDVALSKYRIAAKEWPDSAQLWNNIGMCFYGKQKYVASISCLKRAHYLAPLDWKIMYNLGMVHIGMQQYASAYHYLSGAINLQPKNSMLFVALAISLNNLDDQVNARKAYEKSTQLDPNDPVACINFAIFCHTHGDKKRANKLLNEFYEKLNKMRDSKTGGFKVDQNIVEMGDKLRIALTSGSTDESDETTKEQPVGD